MPAYLLAVVASVGSVAVAVDQLELSVRVSSNTENDRAGYLGMLQQLQGREAKTVLDKKPNRVRGSLYVYLIDSKPSA